MTHRFAGDKKKGQSILGPIEKKFIDYWTPKIPKWITGHGLTYMTIPISLFIVIFSFLAQWNIHWLWGVSLMIFFQWLSDSFDGAIGRYRNSGLARWGYYMDHFLDYIFLCSILIGYSFILPDNFKYLLFFILALFGGFMVNAYLRFASTNELKIAYMGIGPTEVRILFIIINTLLIFFGKTYMAKALPYVLILALAGLCITVYKNSKYIWTIDMKNKNS